MTSLQQRGWVPDASEHSVQELADKASRSTTRELSVRIETLGVHEQDCFNLKPAANVMSCGAEALLASGPGSRPCQGLQPYSILT